MAFKESDPSPAGRGPPATGGSPPQTHSLFSAASATGSLTALGHDIALRRMEHVGISDATTATVVAEPALEYRTYSQIMRG